MDQVEKVHHKMNGLASGISKGFTLIELALVIAIIAILGMVVIPRITVKGTRPRDIFTEHLNMLMNAAYGNAITMGKVHRVVFDLNKDIVFVEQAKSERDSAGQLQFEPIVSEFFTTTLPIPTDFLIKQFFIKGKDSMAGGKTDKVWFFITPEGRAQEVSVVVEDVENRQTFNLVLNPFKAMFKENDTM